MARVSMGLARGIAVAAVLLTGGRVSDPVPSRLERSLDFIRSQNFSPIFAVAQSRIEGHFTRAREEQFLETLFSASGKWKALSRGREAYERFVGRALERTVLEPAALAAMVERIQEDWRFGMSAAENRLLVVLYEDLRPSRPGLTVGRLRVDYERLTAQLAPCVIKDLGMNLCSIAGSEAGAIILTSALTSAGILGGAAASGVWTFGVSLMVGLVVGIVIDETAGQAYEDVARQQIHLKVNEIRNRMTDTVYDALARAVDAYVELQVRCVRALHEGGPALRSSSGPKS
jgi:hypothetical protein